MTRLLSRTAMLVLSACGCSRPDTASAVTTQEPAASVAPRAPSGPAEPGLIGVLIAGDQVDVGARSEGRLEAVLCRLGDRVAKDALLAVVDTRALKREVAVAEAELRVARGELERAKLDVSEARERLERRRVQHAEQVVSGEELAAAEFREKQAAGPGLQIADARVVERTARVEQLRQQILDAEIRAPFEGTVAVRYVDAGAAVARGAPVVRLVATTGLRVRFAIPEDRTGTLAVGVPVRIQIDGFDKRYTGRVEKIAPEVETASRTVLAEATFAEPDPGLGDAKVLSGRVVRVLPDPSGASGQPPGGGP